MERSCAWRALALGLIVALGWMAPACGRGKPKAPSRAEVTDLLSKEAAVTKAGGEDLNPAMRVKATWMLTGIEVREQSKNKDYPWAGTIRFRVRSEARDVESVSVKESDRRYEYLWSRVLQRWILQP